MKSTALGFFILLVTCGRIEAAENITDILDTLVEALKFLISEIDFDPDAGLDIYEFTSKYNYPLENYTFYTEDDYQLSLHRIPYGQNVSDADKEKVRPVVLLAHGMGSSPIDWIWQGVNKSLALSLADEGYDVWLFNARGTTYSMGHKTLIPGSKAYWSFSFHQKGYYDMAATIDQVMAHTQVETISYVGHSQGTTDILVLTSSKPEYNKLVNLAVLFSPIAYMTHMSSPIVVYIRDNLALIMNALDLIGFYGVSYNKVVSYLGMLICNDSSSLVDFCTLFLGAICGFDEPQVDLEKFPVFLGNAPGGLSIRDIDHYIQEMKSGYFRQYDYGAIQNLLTYGRATPPPYNVSQITAPLAIFYAQNDFLAAIEDVERLISELSQDTAYRKLIDYEYFNHLDFISAKDVKTLVYDDAIAVIKKYNPLS